MQSAESHHVIMRLTGAHCILGLSLLVSVAGCAVAAVPYPDAWEPVRWEELRATANYARDKGDSYEAERFCVAALQYVSVSTIKSLEQYAVLLGRLQRPGAETAQLRADMLREAKNRPGPGSVHLGFNPSDELRAYAKLLQEQDRFTDAQAINALADAAARANLLHFARLQMQYQGRDFRGTC